MLWDGSVGKGASLYTTLVTGVTGVHFLGHVEGKNYSTCAPWHVCAHTHVHYTHTHTYVHTHTKQKKN